MEFLELSSLVALLVQKVSTTCELLVAYETCGGSLTEDDDCECWLEVLVKFSDHNSSVVFPFRVLGMCKVNKCLGFVGFWVRCEGGV